MEFTFRSWSNCCYSLKYGVFNCDCSEVQFVLNYICVHSAVYLLTYLFVCLFVCLCKTETSDKTERHASLPSSQNLTQWTLFPSYSYFPKIQLVPKIVFCLPSELILWTWCPTCVNVPILKFIIKVNVHVIFSTAYMIPKWMWSCLYHQHALYVT